MYKQKLTPEESLEVIKYRMKYDVSKTSEENKIVSEQSLTDITKHTLTGAGMGAAGGAAASVLVGGVGAVPGAIIGGVLGLTTALLRGGDSMNRIEDLLKACSTRQKELGSPTLTQGKLEELSDLINTSISGLGTNKTGIKSAFEQIPTIPDLCNLALTYKEYHGDLIEDLKGDLEGDSQWKNNVLTPLRGAIRLSLEASQKIKAAPPVPPAPVPPAQKDSTATPAPPAPKDSTATQTNTDSTKTSTVKKFRG